MGRCHARAARSSRGLGKRARGDARTHVPDAEIMKNLKKEERLARYRHIRGGMEGRGFVRASAVHRLSILTELRPQYERLECYRHLCGIELM